MPVARAMTFLTALAISTPIRSSLTYARKVSPVINCCSAAGELQVARSR